ncbi:MAG TPA: VOC family protein [Polyangiaceae bacterium]|nr:VOC family protein [Polyangiaceae bacterium]
MFAHIGLHVKDLDAAIAFYRAVLAPLGHDLCSRDEVSASFGSSADPALYLYSTPRGPTSSTHLALRAEQRGAVRAFHEQGLRAGAKDHGAPGLRSDYSPDYYAAFLIDPDGNNVEAVCLTRQ